MRRIHSTGPGATTNQWDLSTAEMRARETQALAEARAARASGWATRAHQQHGQTVPMDQIPTTTSKRPLSCAAFGNKAQAWQHEEHARDTLHGAGAAPGQENGEQTDHLDAATGAAVLPDEDVSWRYDAVIKYGSIHYI